MVERFQNIFTSGHTYLSLKDITVWGLWFLQDAVYVIYTDSDLCPLSSILTALSQYWIQMMAVCGPLMHPRCQGTDYDPCIPDIMEMTHYFYLHSIIIQDHPSLTAAAARHSRPYNWLTWGHHQLVSHVLSDSHYLGVVLWGASGSIIDSSSYNLLLRHTHCFSWIIICSFLSLVTSYHLLFPCQW